MLRIKTYRNADIQPILGDVTTRQRCSIAYATDGGDDFSSNFPTLHQPDEDVDDMISKLSHGSNSAPMSQKTNNGNISEEECIIENQVSRPSVTLQRSDDLKHNSTEQNESLLSVSPERSLNPDIDQTDEEGCTLLHKAASRGHLPKVVNLVLNGADPNKANEDGRTALHLAAEEGHEDILTFLSDHGSDVNAQCDLGQTALHTAIKKNHCPSALFLIVKGADIYKRDNNGRTPLHVAAKGAEETPYGGDSLIFASSSSGNLDLVKLFHSRGGDLNEENNIGQNPLHVAASKGYLDIAKYLVQEGCDMNKRDHRDFTPVHGAVLNGHLDVLDYLITQQAKITKYDGKGVLQLAATRGHVDVLKYFIKLGASAFEIDDSGQTSFHVATSMGHLEAEASGNWDIVNFFHDRTFSPLASFDSNLRPIKSCHKNGLTLLNNAIQNTNLEVIDYLITNGAKTNQSNEGSPLYMASRLGHLDAVNVLISRGISVNAESHRGQIPLHAAAATGRIQVVETLIENGSDLNKTDIDGWTPLHAAVQNGHLEVVRYLMWKGAIDIKCRGMTSLHIAAQSGHLDIVKHPNHGAANVNDEDNLGRIPLHSAAMKGDIELVQYLVEQGADVNKGDFDGWTPIHEALQSGNLFIVRYLLEKGAKLTKFKGRTPLSIASSAGHLDIVDFLLYNGADVNEENDTRGIPLHAAAANGSFEIVEKLLNHGSNVNKMADNGRTPLHAAVYSGREDVVRFLISHGATKTRFKGMSVCYIAAQHGYTHLVNYFTMTGCDVNDGTHSGKSPLLAASYNGDMDSVEILVTHGASINQADVNKWTPVHAAAQEGHLPVVTYLVENGADTNARDTDGMTPLHAAGDGDHEDVKQYLLRLRAKVKDERHNDTEKTDGMTPLQGAEDAGHEDVQQCLIRFRGEVQDERHKGTETTDRMTSLQAADDTGHEDVQQRLIRFRRGLQDERHKDTAKTNGMTPLQAAEGAGHEDVQQRLIWFRGVVQDEQHKVTEKTDGMTPLQAAEDAGGMTPLQAAEDAGHEDVQQCLIRFRGGVQDERHKGTEKTDGMTPLQAAEDAGHQDVQQCHIQSRTEVHDGQYDDTDQSFRSDGNCPEMVRGSVMSKVSACDRLSGINGESDYSTPLNVTTASIPMENSWRKNPPWRKNPDTLPRDIKKTIRPTRESCVAKPKTQLHGDEVPATDDLAINRENVAGDPNPGIKNPRRTNPDSISRHIKTTIRPTRMSCVFKPKTQLNGGEVPATNNLTITSENDAVDQKQRIKSKRGNIKNGLSILTLLHRAIAAFAFFFFCCPILVAGNLRWVEPVTLDVGTRGVVPFYLKRPSSSVQFSLYYTIQFGSKGRPFCINGQYDVDGFKNPSQVSRFTTTLIDRDTSLFVNMTIDDVDTIDGDQYIFIEIWRSVGNVLHDSQKKEVIVQRPPGPADCFITLSDSEYPYEVHCWAKTGSMPTILTCYQNDRDLVKVQNITDNGSTTRAIFLLPDTTHFSCCSHAITSTVGAATCNDFEWPPGYSGISSTEATSRSMFAGEQSNWPTDPRPKTDTIYGLEELSWGLAYGFFS
ncbi:serine/threonine-protein phosphatase 6 regulatory ankyrin repeat subunit B-like [Lytechinus variegatus]|uniref:serine/threonine-protein phosphatase 6 regulatory ankyrin repeat subunit B-like n=1 Tax=Lytechinus variegatus TaxID=7654 RepID=UPI001BB20920|nr:serine/threonine-protein phosphatase 6 regulatory ankyrin repeat subunit B-like [Lytechinus variegatus]